LDFNDVDSHTLAISTHWSFNKKEGKKRMEKSTINKNQQLKFIIIIVNE
jgi:hypothetical protein